MKILILSDTHRMLSFSRLFLNEMKPDVVIHLGDHYDDAENLMEFYPGHPFYMVPGNCDTYRAPIGAPQILVQTLGGVRFYITHGHLHGVKQGTRDLLESARHHNVQVVLYGHTHRKDCRQTADGLWVVNPGSAGYYGGSCCLMSVENGKILSCQILEEGDLPRV